MRCRVASEVEENLRCRLKAAENKSQNPTSGLAVGEEGKQALAEDACKLSSKVIQHCSPSSLPSAVKGELISVSPLSIGGLIRSYAKVN